MIVSLIFVFVLSYLLGSVNFAVLFSKAFIKTDVREMGSGNAGTTNMLRTVGILPGVLTFIFDCLKGAASCLLAYYFLSPYFDNSQTLIIYKFVCGIICMLGHAFPVFFGFKGGKCVATGFGVVLAVSPLSAIAGLVLFVLLMFITKTVSVSSLLSTLVCVVLVSLLNGFDIKVSLLSFTVGAIIFLRHSKNIVRIVKGEEKKLDIAKKK